MSTVDNPFGLVPAKRLGSNVNSKGLNAYKIASLTTATLYRGQPVAITANGAADIVTSAGITVGPTVGVFWGCKFTDPVSKRPTWSAYWPGGTSATDAVAYVIDDPDATYFVQADSSVAATAVGAVIGFTTASYTSGTTAFGTSFGKVGTATIGTADGMLRILGKKETPDNDWGDAYTVLHVAIANHAFRTTAGI